MRCRRNGDAPGMSCLEPEGTRLIETAGDVKILLARDNRPTGLYACFKSKCTRSEARLGHGDLRPFAVGTDYDLFGLRDWNGGHSSGDGYEEAFRRRRQVRWRSSPRTATGESVEIVWGLM